MSKFVEINQNIADKVVGSYKKIEDAAVNSYSKVEDTFVSEFLQHKDETLIQAKARLKEKTAEKRKEHEQYRQAHKK